MYLQTSKSFVLSLSNGSVCQLRGVWFNLFYHFNSFRGEVPICHMKIVKTPIIAAFFCVLSWSALFTYILFMGRLAHVGLIGWLPRIFWVESLFQRAFQAISSRLSEREGGPSLRERERERERESISVYIDSSLREREREKEREHFSLYRAVSQREREREIIGENKMSKKPSPYLLQVQ